MAHKGSEAESLLRKSIQYCGVKARLVRLADTADAQAVGGAGLQEQPSDYILFWGTLGGFLEVKQSADMVGFPLKNVAKSQWATVARAKVGDHSYDFFILSTACDRVYLIEGEFLHDCKVRGLSRVPWLLLQNKALGWVLGAGNTRYVALEPLFRAYERRAGL